MFTYIILIIITITIAIAFNEVEDIQADVHHAKYLGQKKCLKYTANIKVRGGWKKVHTGRWSKCWKAARKAAEEVKGAPIWVRPV